MWIKKHARSLAAGGCVAAALSLSLLLPPGRQPVAENRELPRAALNLVEGRLRVPGESGPFTGRLVERFPGGAMRACIEVAHGVADGISRGWFESGQLEVEEHFVKGLSHGLRTRWYENGQKRSETSIVGGQLNGPHVEWHDNGRLAARAVLLNGKPDGVAESWDREGQPKSRALVKSGEVVQQEFANSSAVQP